MWNLPGPRSKPLSPELAGGFLSTALPGKSMTFIMLRYIPSMPKVWRGFYYYYYEKMLNFEKVFSAPTEMIIWLLNFMLLICCITFTDLKMVNQPCIPGIKSHMIMLMCYWTWFASILLGIVLSMFFRDVALQFSFPVVSLFGFGMRVIPAS